MARAVRQRIARVRILLPISAAIADPFNALQFSSSQRGTPTASPCRTGNLHRPTARSEVTWSGADSAICAMLSELSVSVILRRHHGDLPCDDKSPSSACIGYSGVPGVSSSGGTASQKAHGVWPLNVRLQLHFAVVPVSLRQRQA
jgi:hypothetical protein